MQKDTQSGDLKDIFNNRYKIKDVLGRGGMGVVYLVEDIIKDNMQFALKTIKQSILNSHKSAGIETLKNEYEIMTRLKHPSLTQVYDFGADRGMYYIVMEYIHGRLLSDILAKHEALSVKQATDIIVQVLRVLDYIHSRNIIYRDLKPGNIILRNNKVKLLDFGISAFTQKIENNFRGTISYISPESINGRVCFATDLLSAGLVYYELLTGEPFFNVLGSENHIIFDLIDNTNRYNTYLDERLEHLGDKKNEISEILKKMMAYEAEDRYQNGGEIIEDINRHFCSFYEFETIETKESYVLGNTFADREKELKQLEREVQEDKKYVFNIYRGPVGIGKSRLFNEFKKFCKLNSIPFFDASCLLSPAKPYYAIYSILEQTLALADNSLINKFGAHLKILMLESVYLSSFQPVIKSDDPEFKRDTIVQSVSDYIIEFCGNCKKKAVIYFDNIHYMDDGSAEILKAILNKLHIYIWEKFPLIIYSSIDEEKILNQSRIKGIISAERERIQITDLSPLDLNGIREYIINIFGSSFINKSLYNEIPKIKERVGGNPLFLEELIKNLIKKNNLIREKNSWRLVSNINDVDIPQNLRDIVLQRIESLFSDRNIGKVLAILSLMRISPTLDIMKHLLGPETEMDTAEVLLMLEHLEIIQSGISENKTVYSITSSLIKETIKETIENPADLSLFIANSLKSSNEKDAGYLDEIAYQFLEGKDLEKSAYYYEKSGDDAFNNYFNEKAVEYYRKALSIKQYDFKSQIKISLKLAKSLEIIGEWKEAESILENCLSIAEKTNNTKIQIKILNELSSILIKTGDMERAKKLIDTSYHSANKTNDKGMIGDAFFCFGAYYYKKANYNEAIKYYKKSEQICSEIKDEKGLSISLLSIGNIYFSQSRYREAEEYYSKYRSLAEKIGDKRGYAVATGNQGNVYFNQYEYEKALECYKLHFKFCMDRGLKEDLAKTCGNIGITYKLLGDVDRAIEYQELFRKLSVELGEKNWVGIATGNMGSLYKRKGDLDKAMECYKACRRIAEEIGDKRSIAAATGNLGFVYHIQGDFEKALEHIEVYRRISQEIGDTRAVGNALIDTADIYAEIKRTDLALQHYHSAKAVFEQIEDKNEICNALNSIGDIYYEKGRIDLAMDYFSRSLDILVELKCRDSLIIETCLKKAEVYLKSGNFSEAEIANKRTLILAEELKDEKLIIMTKIQAITIKYHDDKRRTCAFLLELLSEYRESNYCAFIFHELYAHSNNEEYLVEAIRNFEGLYRKTYVYLYRKNLKKLEKIREDILKKKNPIKRILHKRSTDWQIKH